jgi:hypothetical protein
MELLLRFGLFGNHGFGYGTATDATGASFDGYNLTGVELMTNLLQVGHEATFCFDVGMADIIAGLWTFSTDIANLRHCDLLAYSLRIVSFFILPACWNEVFLSASGVIHYRVESLMARVFFLTREKVTI